MLKVPAKYREMAERDAREVSVKVVMGETELTNDDIIELSIYRSLGENGFNIGGAVTARVRMVALMKLPYSGEVSMDVFVRFGFDSESCSEYVQLGHFYGHASNPSNKTAQVEIIGYDKLGSSAFNSRCTFAKVGDAELTFPCTVQEMLEYVCKRRGLETEFECLDYTVSEMPVKDKSRDNSDYEKYYTYKEIIGFIAAAHGATAAIDSGGSLVFIGAKESSETISSGDCVDFSLTASEAFTVKGILLHVQNTLSTGSANIFINDDSETAYDGEISEGVIETSCPFGSIEMAESLWEQLGGFSYSSCEFSRRGRGWTELGDIVSAVDNLREKVNGEYIKGKAVVQTVELSFSTDGGFTERVISKAENSEESAERLGTANVINNASENTEKIKFKRNNIVYGVVGIHDADGAAGIALSMTSAAKWIGLLDENGDKILEYGADSAEPNPLEPAHRVSGDLWVLPCRKIVSEDGTEEPFDIYFQHPFKEHTHSPVEDANEYGDPTFSQCTMFWQNNRTGSVFGWPTHTLESTMALRIKDAVISIQINANSNNMTFLALKRPKDTSFHNVACFRTFQYSYGYYLQSAGTLFAKASEAQLYGSYWTSAIGANGQTDNPKATLSKYEQAITTEEDKDFYEWLFDERYIYSNQTKRIKIYKDIILMNGAKIYNEDGTEYTV